MKHANFFFTLALVVCSFFYLNAQVTASLRVGGTMMEASFDASNQVDDIFQDGMGLPVTSTSNSARFGKVIAAEVAIPFSDRFGLLSGFQFNDRGGKFEATILDPENNIEYDLASNFRLTYFEVPLLARFTFGDGAWRFAALVGPSVGLAMGGTDRVEVEAFHSGMSLARVEQENDIDLSYREAHLSLQTGLEVRRMLGEDFGLLFDARYLTTLAEEQNDYLGGVKYNNISLSAGLWFTL